MVARAFGSGTVSFGLVSIPIKVYTTNKPGSSISFNLLHEECGTKLKQQYICPKDNEVVPRDKMAKGYEYAKGQYVMLNEEEIKALEAVSNNTIALSEFVPAEAVDPLYIEKSYYIGPDKGGERAYALLGRAMTDTGLVGLARYSARGKQYVVMVRPYGEKGLVMHQLRYQDQIRAFDEVPLEDTPPISDGELGLAVQIIEQIAANEFKPEKYSDEVKERVLELIQHKIDGEEITVTPEAPRGEIIDLMEALKASLGGTPDDGAETARKPAKPAPRQQSTPSAAKASESSQS
ncbi:MAG: Ku protein [Proteobacteria bacterium]|nr:Ku protein [Pseudomonadota bacterium]